MGRDCYYLYSKLLRASVLSTHWHMGPRHEGPGPEVGDDATYYNAAILSSPIDKVRNINKRDRLAAA
jgi:hypothetical protein